MWIPLSRKGHVEQCLLYSGLHRASPAAVVVTRRFRVAKALEKGIAFDDLQDHAFVPARPPSLPTIHASAKAFTLTVVNGLASDGEMSHEDLHRFCLPRPRLAAHQDTLILILARETGERNSTVFVRPSVSPYIRYQVSSFQERQCDKIKQSSGVRVRQSQVLSRKARVNSLAEMEGIP